LLSFHEPANTQAGFSSLETLAVSILRI
jgi:hypothetical protein